MSEDSKKTTKQRVPRIPLHGPGHREIVVGFERVVDRDGDIVCTPKRATSWQLASLYLVPSMVAVMCDAARGKDVKKRAAKIVRRIAWRR